MVQQPPFEDEILKFEAADREHMPKPGGVLFVGSSSIRLWKSLKEDFPNLQVLNRGFGGSQIEDSVRLVDRIVVPYKPKAIVFFAGTNDLAAGKTPERVLSDYNAFVTKVWNKLPGVPIAFIAITPAPSRWANVKNIRQANDYIRNYTASRPGLRFVDVFPLMLDANGQPRPELFIEDRLHMKPAGYAIWVKAVTPVIDEMLTESR